MDASYPSLVRLQNHWRLLFHSLACWTLLAVALWGQAEQAGKISPEFRGQAIKAAWETNLNYCQEWLAGKDFKTLGETAAGLSVLADVQAKQTANEDWQKSAKRLRELAGQMQAAAKAENAEQAKTILGELRELYKAFAQLPVPQEPAEIQPVAGKRLGMGAVMTLIDGTFADAKTSVSRGNPLATKYNAFLLAELGELLSNERNDARWLRWCAEFSQAAQHTATTAATDATELRSQLKLIRTRCDNCHNKR